MMELNINHSNQIQYFNLFFYSFTTENKCIEEINNFLIVLRKPIFMKTGSSPKVEYCSVTMRKINV